MVLITPEIATRFLGFNEQNRRVRHGWVGYLAYSIKSGEWQATHQGIAFSESGRLLDGQHRLMAIVKADIAINVMVTYGLPDNAFSAIDNGMKRTDEDLTKLPKRMTEVAKFFIYLMAFEGTENPTHKGGCSKITPSQIHLYADILRVFFEFMIKKASSSAKVFSTAPVVSAAIYNIMMGESPDYVGNTFCQLVLGDTQAMPPICHSAVRQLITGRITTRGGSEVRLDNFVRFIPVFREANKNIQKLMTRDRITALNEVRQNLKPWFSTEGQLRASPKIEKIKLVVNEYHAEA